MIPVNAKGWIAESKDWIDDLLVLLNERKPARHIDRAKTDRALAADSEIRVAVRAAFDRMTRGEKPGIGRFPAIGVMFMEDDEGFHLDINPYTSKRIVLNLQLLTGTLAVWANKELRERLRRCTNCGDFYFQQSKKRNTANRYFCSSVTKGSTCASDWHDAQKSPNRTHRKPKPPRL